MEMCACIRFHLFVGVTGPTEFDCRHYGFLHPGTPAVENMCDRVIVKFEG